MERRRLLAVIVIALPLLTFPAAALTTPPLPIGETGNATVVGVQGPSNHGKVARVGPSGDVTILASDAASYHDVSRLSNGRLLVTYVDAGKQHCGQFEPPCARTGVRILENGTVSWQWSYLVDSMGNSEVHDAELLSDRGEVLIVGMDRERVFTVDRETGEIVWQWNASQHYDAPPDPTSTDWLHMNDVDRISDGRYLVSVRNANQLVIVNRSCTCVRAVINEDGDPRVMRGQHNPQWLGPGRVLVADSSNDRVVELAKNESSGEWRVVWSRGRAAGLRFAWPRDADRLPNGHTLITDSRNNRIVELDESGEVVAVFRTPKLPYEADRLGREPVGGPSMSGRTSAAATGEGGVPVFSRAVVGLHHSVGAPRWLSGWHLAALWWSLTAGLAYLIVYW